MTPYHSADTMKELIGSDFSVLVSEDLSVDLQLSEVSSIRDHGPYASFSMIFNGKKEPVLGQNTYCFRHRDIEETPLFMVPLGIFDEVCEYQVCLSYKKGQNSPPQN